MPLSKVTLVYITLFWTCLISPPFHRLGTLTPWENGILSWVSVNTNLDGSFLFSWTVGNLVSEKKEVIWIIHMNWIGIKHAPLCIRVKNYCFINKMVPGRILFLFLFCCVDDITTIPSKKIWFSLNYRLSLFSSPLVPPPPPTNPFISFLLVVLFEAPLRISVHFILSPLVLGLMLYDYVEKCPHFMLMGHLLVSTPPHRSQDHYHNELHLPYALDRPF